MAIVFGTNLKADNQVFADVAALMAQRMDETLRLVHVSEDPRAPFVLGTDEEHLLGAVRASLQEEAERLHALSGCTVQVHLAAGSVLDALVSVAEFELATVLIVGSRAHRSPHVLGETAERVARKSPVPVLTLREPERLESWLRGQQALRVLIGSDLGHAATSARMFANKLTKLGSCAFEIIYVVSPAEVNKRLGLTASALSHRLEPEVEAALIQKLKQTTPNKEESARLRVIPARGSPDAYLVTLAEQESFDLIIIGQRQQSFFENLWSGSVSRGVVRSSPISVICVPASSEKSIRPFQPYRTIIVGDDFSQVSEQAIIQALGLMAPGGTLHRVHIIPSAQHEADAKEAMQQAWYRITKASLPESAEESCRVQRHVLEGDPSEQILAIAERVAADLIVLGNRSRTAVSRTILGSVARGVTENSPIPVLIIPFGSP